MSNKSESWLKIIHERKKAGTCTRCSKKPVKGKKMCQEHLDREADYTDQKRQRKIKVGLCIVPGCTSKPDKTHRRCKRHHELVTCYNRAYRKYKRTSPD